jgi:protein TonB
MDSNLDSDLTVSRDDAVDARPRHRAWRWPLSMVFAVMLHGGALAALVATWSSPLDDAMDGAPAVLVELAPVTAAPAVQTPDLAPGPLAADSDAQQGHRQVAKPDLTPPQPATVVATRDNADTEPQKSNADAPSRMASETAKADAAADIPEAETPPVLASAASADPVVQPGPDNATQANSSEAARPEMEPPHRPKPHPASRTASRASAPSKAAMHARAAAPAPGAGRSDSAVPTWRSELVARLERSKRYPPDAHGDEGVALLAFSVDHHGDVHGARIARSSGSAALDRETLSLLTRARPLPPPPAELAGARIAVTVPIRYDVR